MPKPIQCKHKQEGGRIFASSQTQQVNGTACMYRQRMLASAQVWGSRVTVQHRAACHTMPDVKRLESAVTLRLSTFSPRDHVSVSVANAHEP